MGGDPRNAGRVGLPSGPGLISREVLLVEPDAGTEAEHQRHRESFTGGEIAEQMAALRGVPAGRHLHEAVDVTANDTVFLGDNRGDLLDRDAARLDCGEEWSIADLALDGRELRPDPADELARLRTGRRQAMRCTAGVETGT